MRTLSSAQTFLMKCVLPLIWIAGFGAGVFALWLGLMRVSGAPESGPSLIVIKINMTAIWIAGSTFLWWGCVRLKRVRVDDTTLFVSDYLREIAVPLAAIDRVTEIRWINIHPVTIHVDRDTGFGNSIVFMPKTRTFAFWSAHPVVAELEQAARLARGR